RETGMPRGPFRRNESYFRIMDEIKAYERMKQEENKSDKWAQIIVALRNLKRRGDPGTLFPCSACWAQFVTSAQFTAYVEQSEAWRTLYYFVPDMDTLWQTTANTIGLQPPGLPKEGFSVTYNWRNQFVALVFYDLMMWDFDFKDTKLSAEGI